MGQRNGKTVKVKLIIEGGEATPAPPVGTTLGSYGVNIMKFCENFNKRTKDRKDQPVPVVLTINTFKKEIENIKLKQPPTSYFIKRAAGIASGSPDPKGDKVGTITQEQLKDIAKTKMHQLNTKNIKKAMKIIEGTCKSMGIMVIEEGINNA